jgi:thiamine biosynthesis protein ThiI
VTRTLLVHYQELTLKGRNRPWFIDRLVSNLREVTAGLGVAEVRPVMGRIEVSLRPQADVTGIAERLQQTLGVSSVSIAERVEPALEVITSTALRLVAGRGPATFRVATARADKAFPMQSPEVERHVGGAVQAATGWRVNLTRPEVVVGVEILPRAAYVFADKRRGPGGLPVGVSGRVACLLSGGIDSPVAAFRLMRRGCRVLFVHFHGYPMTSDASQQKARRLVQVLTAFQLRSRLVLVPFGDLQRRILVAAPPAVRVVLYRRFMMRIAERIARRANARALVTGEVIGQVSSQTLENLAAIDAATTLPVLRPLIGMDKEEITAEARRLGTLPISILPDDDCCQVFLPKHPALNVTRGQAEEIEKALPVDALVREVLSQVVRERYSLADAADVWAATGR